MGRRSHPPDRPRGEPSAFIPFHRPEIGREEEEAVISVLRSGWLTTGGQTKRFEEEFARYVGAPHALALCSATAGLHLSLEALGTAPGTVVVTSPYTFAATAEVARYLGAELAFVDIEEETNNLDPALLEKALHGLAQEGKKVSAIIPVHVAGLSCDMEAISRLASRDGIPVVEDAAHAFPVKSGGRFVGTMGDTGVYSFYATKPITTGEGGMVVTASEEIAKRIRIMRLHGIDRDVWNRYSSADASWRYDVVAPGYKYNLTDLASAIGLAQLAKAERNFGRRRELARRYLEGFSDCPSLILPPDREDHGWHLFIVRIRPETLSVDRDAFIEELRTRGIGTSVHFIPLHLMTYYRERYRLKPEDFPVALGNFNTCISLPLFPSLSDAEADRVIRTVQEICAERRA
jgi:dTDP-4-amino-4,6-dideoxygalactose transaminase